MKIIDTIEGCEWIDNGDGSITVPLCFGRVCTDGIGRSWGDKTHQNQTAYRAFGKYLNADLDFYGVLPEILIDKIPGIVKGCQMHAVNTLNGHSTDLVCGEVGPSNRSGEFARIAIIALGGNPDPNNGGFNTRCIRLTMWPGRPALVHGKLYPLVRSV